MIVLEINDIHKSYKNNHALQGISFTVPKGSIFGILGPNGSGKTTLLGILLNVINANKGTFSWHGAGSAVEVRKNIGTLLETPNFYHYLSAERNLEIVRQISGRGSKEDIELVLKKVGLYDRRSSPFKTYSLGMKQRLAIGAALLGSPSVIVLDEPTNGLDPVGIAEVRELILDLKNSGHTVIVASHLLDEVEKICSHVAIMKLGNLLACGAVSEILKNNDIVEVNVSDMQLALAAISELPGVLSYAHVNGLLEINFNEGTADLAAINSFFFGKNIILNHLVLKKQRLETRFFELTQN